MNHIGLLNHATIPIRGKNPSIAVACSVSACKPRQRQLHESPKRVIGYTIIYVRSAILKGS